MIKTGIALVFALPVVFVALLARDISVAVGVKFSFAQVTCVGGAVHQMVAVGLV